MESLAPPKWIAGTLRSGHLNWLLNFKDVIRELAQLGTWKWPQGTGGGTEFTPTLVASVTKTSRTPRVQKRRGSPVIVQRLWRVRLGTGFTEAHQARARGGAVKATGQQALLRSWRCGCSERGPHPGRREDRGSRGRR